MAWTVKAGPLERAGNALAVAGTALAETDAERDI
jgi:hypothetical protein